LEGQRVRARDLGLACGSLPAGERNSIADVPGVTVGHMTLIEGNVRTGACADALIRRAIEANPEIGRQTSTVNAVVLECDDGYLNDIQAMAVTEAHAFAAIDAAEDEFASGSV